MERFGLACGFRKFHPQPGCVVVWLVRLEAVGAQLAERVYVYSMWVEPGD